jgi:hypothetical protein
MEDPPQLSITTESELMEWFSGGQPNGEDAFVLFVPLFELLCLE